MTKVVGGPRHPVVLGDGAVGVRNCGPEVTVLLQEGTRRGRRVVEDHADHVRPIGCVRLLEVETGEVGGLLLARDAPAGEEVDHDVVATEGPQGDGIPGGQIGPAEVGGTLAEQGGFGPPWPPGACGWPGRCPPRPGRAGRLPPPSGPRDGDAGSYGARDAPGDECADRLRRRVPFVLLLRRRASHQVRRRRDRVGGPPPRARDQREHPPDPDEQAAGPQPRHERFDHYADGDRPLRQVVDGLIPDDAPSPPTVSKVRYTSSKKLESMAGVPTTERALPKLVVAG